MIHQNQIQSTIMLVNNCHVCNKMSSNPLMGIAICNDCYDIMSKIELIERQIEESIELQVDDR